MSILEIAELTIRPGEEAAFEQGVGSALPLFRRAQGFQGLALRRVLEHSSTYQLIVGRGTVENHTVDFRGSDDFQAWRELVGPYFAAAPRVVHLEAAVLHVPALDEGPPARPLHPTKTPQSAGI